MVAAGLFFILLYLFANFAHEVVRENEEKFDKRAFEFFASLSLSGMNHTFKAISFFGSTMFMLTAYVLLVSFLLIKKRKRDAINIAILGTVSTAMMFALKEIIARERPELPLFRELTNYSFPSGHASSSFISFSILGWLVWRSRIRKGWKIVAIILLMLFSLAIVISRIVLRYHYASDVLAGFCLGLAWVLLFFLVLERMKRNKEISDTDESTTQ